MIGKRITFVAVLLVLLSLGTSAQITQKQYWQQVTQLQQKQHQLSETWLSLPDNDSINKTRINEQMQALNEKLFQWHKDYVATFPSDETTARILLNYYTEFDFLAAYEQLSPEVRNGSLRDSLETLRTQLLRNQQAEENMARMVTGAKAPDFRLPSIKGDSISLYGLLGERAVVLDFWGTWCYWCMKGLPRMREYYQKYNGRVEFVGIDCQDQETAWRQAIEKERMVWTQLRNGSDNDVSLLYGVQCFPTKIIIDASGHIVKVFEGETEEFYQTLDSLFSTESAYDCDSLLNMVANGLPKDAMMAGMEQFEIVMLQEIDRRISRKDWAERLKADFVCGILEGNVYHDQKPMVDFFIQHSQTDSLQAKVRRQYDDFLRRCSHLFPGQPAPMLSFTDRDGQQLTLQSLQGKAVLLDIWGTWCIPCIEEFPHLQALQQRYANDPRIRIVSVACDKKRDRWLTFLSKHPEMTWTQYLIDPESNEILDKQYQAIGIPRFILIDERGMLIDADCPRPSEPTFVEYLEKQLSRSVHLRGSIANYDGTPVLLYLTDPGTGYDTLHVNRDGTFDVQIPLQHATDAYFILEDTKTVRQFFAQPGTEAIITCEWQTEEADGKQQTTADVKWAGDNLDCYDYLNSHDLYDLMEPWPFTRIDTLTFKDYQHQWLADIEQAKAELRQHVSNPQFNQMKSSLLDSFGQHGLWRFFWSNAKEDAESQAWIDSHDHENPQDMETASQWFRWYDKHHHDTPYLDRVRHTFHNQEIINAFADSYITGYIKSAPQDMKEELDKYLALSTNPEGHAEAKKLYEHYKNLVVGSTALPFTMTDVNGKEVQFSDFRGRAVYFDIWATWCGPCVAEIPYMEKLAEHYKNDSRLQIISISLDQNERAWRRKLEKDCPQWPQYICRDNFKSQLCQNYDIDGIPRFMMFDKEGRIISLDAPRPSAENIIEWIESNLK